MRLISLLENKIYKYKAKQYYFDKNKRYSFSQIDRVHQYKANLKPLKTKMMNLRTNSQHLC